MHLSKARNHSDHCLKFCAMGPGAVLAATRLGWSARSTHRALKVARTIADLAGAPVWLGLAMAADGALRLKPQNLLLNLPLARPH